MRAVAAIALAACLTALASAALSANGGKAGTVVPGPFYDNIAGLDGPSFQPPTPQVIVPTSSVTISTWFGAYPCLGCGGPKQAQWCNGGIPQLANLTLHQETIARDLDALHVPLNYTGMLINDYESWHLDWDLSPEAYHNASRRLVMQRNPYLTNATEIDAIAKAEYNAAALEFFVATLEGVKAARPNVSVGLYNYPGMYTYWSIPERKQHFQAVNDRSTRLWAVTDVFAPSIYLPYKSNADVPYERNVQFIDGQLAEVDRVRKVMAGAAPGHAVSVAPYTWHRYHDGEPHGLELLDPLDACLEFASLFANGSRVDGAIMWGDETQDATNRTMAAKWLTANARWLGGAALPNPIDCPALVGQTAAARQLRMPSEVATSRRVPVHPASTTAVASEGAIPPYTRCSL